MKANEIMALLIDQLLVDREILPTSMSNGNYYYCWSQVRELLIDLTDKPFKGDWYKKVPKKHRVLNTVNIKGIIWSIKNL